MKLAALAQLWPPVRVGVFLLGLSLLWLPLALPLYWLAATGRLALGGAIATGLLYIGFLAFWPSWAKRVHQLHQPWKALGLSGDRGVGLDWLVGLSLGLGGIAALVTVERVLGWAELAPAPANFWRIAVEGILVATLVGLAEEILFRGWLLFELEQGFTAAQALIGTTLVFATAHFIKPLPAILATLPQFFGLFLLGLTLSWARRTPSHRASGQPALGYPAGLHSGLVGGYYLISVGQVVQIKPAAPAWITGLQGNPLAGLLGLTLLAVLASLFYRGSRQPAAHRNRL